MPDTPVARRRLTPLRCAIAMAAATAVLLTGACSDGGNDGGKRRSITDIIGDAIDQAKERQKDESGNTRGGAQPAPSLGTDGNTSFDYADYQQTLSSTLGLLERYWEQALPPIGGTFRAPRAYTYYRSDEGAGPACGGQAAPPNNAFYCPAGDFIAWDESGLMIPYFVQGGDFAASFVLAHEFGHAMQARLPRQEPLGVLRELQADCFAGSWTKWVAQQQLLEAGDLDEAVLAVFIARDVPGTPWTDPAAHGSGFERTRAFGDGFESGPASCYPAPGERWIVGQR